MSAMNYDPNLTNSGRMAVQTVKVTLGEWLYRRTFTVTVGGNCTGLRVIEAAVSRVHSQLQDEQDTDFPTLKMASEDGKECLFDDDQEEGEEWLADMLIAAEIIAITPEVKKGASK